MGLMPALGPVGLKPLLKPPSLMPACALVSTSS
jgi:hypothetical protein